MAEAVCIASGPSLTADDVEQVRQWRAADRLVLVTNTTYRLAPWADVVFGMDAKWWDAHIKEIRVTCTGRLVTSSAAWERLKIESAQKAFEGFNQTGNSGACIITIAARLGAHRIVLLGYDGQRTNGKTHWHGNHPKPLGNGASMPRWAQQFAHAIRLAKVPVVNATRYTALKSIPRLSLVEALYPAQQAA